MTAQPAPPAAPLAKTPAKTRAVDPELGAEP
jgi:hypothetical protein